MASNGRQNKQDPDQDPYNQPVYKQHYLDPSDNQMAYDTMYTILEVDSEGSELSAVNDDRLDHLLSEQRAESLEGRGERSSSPEDKFSGTLSALAQQVERLRRASPQKGRDSPAQEPSPAGRESSESTSSQDASTSPISSLDSDESREVSEVSGSEQLLEPTNKPTRTNSADSLMMITVSPIESPTRLKFPILRGVPKSVLTTTNESALIDNNNKGAEERRVVEVSNRSTMTSIDLSLMEKMAEKYFVDKRDKATQSIKFDCDENEFDTIEFNSRDGSVRRRPVGSTGQSGSSSRPMKSVAVGTEKFSRERFSLLPPTKTRSTQTKANSSGSTDIGGTSETRRFKLSHPELGPMRPQKAPEASETPEAPETPDKRSSEQDRDSLSAESPKLPSIELVRETDKRVERGHSSDSLSGSSVPTATPSQEEHVKEKPAEKETTNEENNSTSSALIPSVKTELRVIIEFNNSKQKHKSEILSDSQFINGKLSKKTQVNTSKQVVASPREVFNKLQSIGREHSLLYAKPEAAATPPAAVRAANESALRWSGGNLFSEHADWREVSKSSMVNEIEADCGRSKSKGAGQERATDLVMSTQATINHSSDDKCAIELKSRAAKRYEALKRDSKSGQLVRSGQLIGERTLVESEAAFDENDSVEGVAAPESAERVQRPLSASPVVRRSQTPNPKVELVQSPTLSERPASRTSRSRIEIEEESEDRHQVTRNGQVVYDDKLNERRFEVQRSSTPNGVPHELELPGILRNPKARLLKPVSLQRVATPTATTIPFADGTGSNISSEPETMDSGFAMGSSSLLNGTQSRSSRTTSRQQQLEDEPESLTFVDDDDADELIEQLNVRQQPNLATSRNHKPFSSSTHDVRPKSPGSNQAQQYERFSRRASKGKAAAAAEEPDRALLISPPPAFRSSEPALNRLHEGVAAPSGDTELVTRLTRTKRRPNESSGAEMNALKRTLTRFEQSVGAPAHKPESRFRAQVLFESDTDSMAERQSANSSRSGKQVVGTAKKELLSETSYSRTTNKPDHGHAHVRADASKGRARVEAKGSAKLEPKWDYSLRLNRMRGNKVDSRANTYIRHSRQMLINTEAS